MATIPTPLAVDGNTWAKYTPSVSYTGIQFVVKAIKGSGSVYAVMSFTDPDNLNGVLDIPYLNRYNTDIYAHELNKIDSNLYFRCLDGEQAEIFITEFP